MLNKTAASGKGQFGDLTDDLLRHVLSFLPAADALQTCVLDTRWRDLWRRTTDLLLVFDETSFPSSGRFKQLVKLFIHLRGNSPLDKCKIVACVDDEEGCTYTNTMLLIKYALKCQVKELLLSVAVEDDDTVYDPIILDAPLISQHLKLLHLEQVNLKFSALNFSRCPVLEDLKMQRCGIDGRRISSKSLKRLCISDFCYFPEDFHVRIFAPGLISLQLDGFNGLTPSLEYMPFLEIAYVGLRDECYDFCRSNRQDCEFDDCGCHAYPVGEGVLLHGLSNAVNLELIADHGSERFIYTWDLKCCPIFDKLKTLLLSEWFTTVDLVCILQHSPILEMLTLQLDNTKKLVRATGAQEMIDQSFVCLHLKVVNIECRKVDEGVRKILTILSTCGIPREQIGIKEQLRYSDRN
ncbi:unnamed protein product [Triticum turgidum subsp. durum]|uniref:F-box domain-containing protein n=1 Tax=Triticum turgidum subsp. durum TaxID=4567 RepID=A0A9R1BF86_TRITD|nr:unnamed protein product [Triticum turgidum subsp. durum]